MLQPIFDFLDTLSTDFTWKRALVITCMLALTALTLFAYELNTSTSQLSKYERSISILEKLESIELKSTEAKEIKKSIYLGLNEINSPTPDIVIFKDFDLDLSIESKQALLTACPWILLSLIFLIRIRHDGNAFLGCISVALLMAGFGYVAAVGFSPSQNSIHIPAAVNIIMITIVLIIQSRKKSSIKEDDNVQELSEVD